MRIRRYAIIISALFFLAGVAAAQEPLANQVCGYTGKSPWLEWYQKHRQELAGERGADTNWLYVPVTVHLVGKDDGTGHFKLDRAIQALCNMNSQYADARIRFYLYPGDGVRYLNNSAWFQHEFHPGGSEMIEQNKIDGRLNAFVVSDPAGNCGYSWKDAIVLGTNCSGENNTTWAHEAGHHLSLPHPFSGWENFEWDYKVPAPEEIDDHFVERTDSSNCEYAGDGFCDTPPDYLHDRWSCNVEKKSYTVQLDPDGVEFRSDATLIMGYALDECASRFSVEQVAAMRANLNDEHEIYTLQTPPFSEIEDNAVVELISPVDSHYVQYNDVTLNWNLVPNATFYTVEVGLAPHLAPKLFYQTYYNTTSAKITANLPNNKVYKWRVLAYNEWDLCQPNNNAQVGIFRTRNLTATNDLERLVVAELSPNPVSGGIPAFLTVTTDETMDAVLSVTDAAGKMCQRDHLRLNAGENNFEVPTGNLSAGLYVVTLQNEKGTLVKRLAVTE